MWPIYDRKESNRFDFLDHREFNGYRYFNRNSDFKRYEDTSFRNPRVVRNEFTLKAITKKIVVVLVSIAPCQF